MPRDAVDIERQQRQHNTGSDAGSMGSSGSMENAPPASRDALPREAVPATKPVPVTPAATSRSRDASSVRRSEESK